jgi:fucose 4-O-acetylase-like acetyltransferase
MPKGNSKKSATTQPAQKQRIAWIDVFKGIAIALVVAGHAASPYNPYIYQFHMAAFLWIAGFTSKLDSTYSGWELFIKKWRRLMWPYISFVSFFSILFFALRQFQLEKLFFTDVQDLFFQPIWHFNALTSFNYTNPLAGVSWFLLLLFETSVIGYFGYQTAKKLRLPDWLIWSLSVAVFAFFALKIWPKWPGTRMNYSVDLLPICWLFFYSGYLTNKYQLLRKLDTVKSLIITVFGVWLFSEILPIKNDYPPRLFSPFLYVLIAGLNGSILVWSISTMIAKISWLSASIQFLGQRTMAIFFCHFFCFKFVSAFLVMIGQRDISQLALLTPPAGDQLWWLYWLVGLIMPLIIDSLLRKYAITRKAFLGEP